MYPNYFDALRLSRYGAAMAFVLMFAPGVCACPCGTNCMCGASCQCGGAATTTTPSPSEALQVRQNAASLTAQQRQDFVSAVLALKNTFEPGQTVSVYDNFVLQHQQGFLGGHAHNGPAFLPWHRQFLLNFERALQTVNPNVTIPYWDFTVDQSPTGTPWTSDFLGGNGNPDFGFVVTDGPFRQGQWVLPAGTGGPDLRREFGLLLPTLPTPADVEAAFQISQYDVAPWDVSSSADKSFRSYIEGGASFATGEPELHNRVHLWVGGSMSIVNSPNDPVFWLLHANIDRIWSEWQARYGLTYMPTMGGPRGHNLNDPMSPFGVTPAGVLDHFALGYMYDTEVVPEPTSWLLLGTGTLVLLMGSRVRRRKRAREDLVSVLPSAAGRPEEDGR